MFNHSSSWVCCQIGAREHYAVPRALHQAGELTTLITDAWILPNSRINRLPKGLLTNLRERFHPDLATASVTSFNNSLISFEIAQIIQKSSGWQRVIARNNWFQKLTLQSLKALTPKLKSPVILFSYSYAALELFRYAKSQGWYSILGQIDPGEVEEKLVLAAHSKYPAYQSSWEAAPPSYWKNWQEECLLADKILVNSNWSNQALQQLGIPEDKINIIPLAYQPPIEAYNFARAYPTHFSAERPLRVLFLGQVILRKGIAALLEAAEILHSEPIEFWIVGSQSIPQPQDSHSKIHWVGAVSRSTTAKYYQMADVFLFPTLSDGFGITQLEAQAWNLPIIASKFCGEVVRENINGLVLPEVTASAIAQKLQFCLNNPQKLEAFAQQSTDTAAFNLSQLQHSLKILSGTIP
ncbi:group 1 glycosyl transferase [Tolypothrix tenuis PCC 7101]|uniref:Group 1 glycosyl transferase n=1 Tax=Tolypothrix tenuis PCC 7101 TaxID=231146 RepID=A0A1Z4MVU2_9CYAN|nr:glycosyltransferase family 4 protein [Aulosira sp. FACHB-113]BAY97606.1 group 1 glycosyl transferase [Tolypothrix tenuis PCC 7101]BAZ71886.1 group 1 glycosyl transferase [Aulosira laxa NIES-50]